MPLFCVIFPFPLAGEGPPQGAALWPTLEPQEPLLGQSEWWTEEEITLGLSGPLYEGEDDSPSTGVKLLFSPHQFLLHQI